MRASTPSITTRIAEGGCSPVACFFDGERSINLLTASGRLNTCSWKFDQGLAEHAIGQFELFRVTLVALQNSAETVQIFYQVFEHHFGFSVATVCFLSTLIIDTFNVLRFFVD